VRDRILQSAGQDLLTRHIFKLLWTPLAGDYLVRHLGIFVGLSLVCGLVVPRQPWRRIFL